MSDEEFDSKVLVVFGFLLGAAIVFVLGYFFMVVPLEERVSLIEDNYDIIKFCDANSSTCTIFSVKERVTDLTFANNNAFDSINKHETRIRAIEDFLNQVVLQPASQGEGLIPNE